MSGHVSVWVIEHPLYGFLERIEQGGTLAWCDHTSEAILFRNKNLATKQAEMLPSVGDVYINHISISNHDE